MGVMGDILDDVNRLIIGITKEAFEGIVDYTKWFVAQVFLDAVVKPYGPIVDLGFIVTTGRGYCRNSEQLNTHEVLSGSSLRYSP